MDAVTLIFLLIGAALFVGLIISLANRESKSLVSGGWSSGADDIETGYFGSKFGARRERARNEWRSELANKGDIGLRRLRQEAEYEGIQATRSGELTGTQISQLRYQEGVEQIRVGGVLAEEEGKAGIRLWEKEQGDQLDVLKETQLAQLAATIAYKHKFLPEVGATEILLDQYNAIVTQQNKLAEERPSGWAEIVAELEKQKQTLQKKLKGEQRKMLNK